MFFKKLLTQNYNAAFNKGFYPKQTINCSLRLFEHSYDQKYICKVFQKQFNISFFILKFPIVNLAACQAK